MDVDDGIIKIKSVLPCVMANKCYICDSGCDRDPIQETGPSRLPFDAFTQYVLEFPANPNPNLVKPSSLASNCQLTFCPRCTRQLNRLQDMQCKIRNLQAKCSAVKENLLSTTLSTLISIGLRGPARKTEVNPKIAAGPKRLGQLATKLAKQHVFGFRIYRKWRRRFIRELKTHLLEFKPPRVAEFGSGSNDDQTTAPTNYGETQDGRHNRGHPAEVHALGAEDSSDTNSRSYSQTDHSYSSKPLGKSSKSLHAATRSWKRKLNSSSYSLDKRKPQITKLKLISKPKSKSTTLEKFHDQGEKQLKADMHQMVIESDRTEALPQTSLASLSAATDHSSNKLGSSAIPRNDIQETRRSSANSQVDKPAINLPTQKTDKSGVSQTNQNPSKNGFRQNSKSNKAGRSRSHKEKPMIFECDKENCKKLFNSRKQLQIHKRIHGGEKKYLCDTCGSLFLSLASLHSHRKTHLGLKPYKCQTCQRSFRSAGHLSKHSLIHSGEKPFSCSVCDKLFNRKENLRVHEFTHAAIKPYKCTICNEAYFTQPNLLRKHVIQKHLPPAPSPSRRKRISRSSTSLATDPVYQLQSQASQPQPATYLLQYSDHGACDNGMPYAVTSGTDYGLMIANDGMTTTAGAYETGNEYVQHAFVLPDGQYLIIH